MIRWEHPVKGLLSPDTFLDDITGSEFIVQLDAWVVNQAFIQVSEWNDLGFYTVISVNVSSESILGVGFIEKVLKIRKEYSDVNINQIEFEILETSLLQDVHLAKSILSKLRKIGFKIALDDFGTGYSSLSYLRSLPTDYIKIDQGFIRGILSNSGDLAIVDGIIQIAKAFNIKVVAEGVEDSDIFDQLNSLGCDIAQGYFLSKPMQAERVPEWSSSKSMNTLR
ncbi:EAL domain-containing protein [Thiomicrorhabdus aquaedulcis]|uniref:EAL domain-containing protein n=1 Tax=Thiomicrorhabdus aquaedulcis TaxID=2211106 RepID=UPI001561CBC0|nr:EAL domain-containing protein [Thiomicrorhabdus aquaedulcis]